ncbi:MAG: stage V sporulation protein AD [Defluviitaleaceae bacterium]|nr:stage V sporulation protein AD [Defluviitaleaceae bacterium]
MMDKQCGAQSIRFTNPPVILASAAVVGPKEGEGPLAKYFDRISSDILFGQDSWEKAESEMVRQGISLAVQNANLTLEQIRYILAGDLLNQGTGSTFGVRSLGRPFFGLFGACSTMGEAMSLGAVLVDGGYADYVVSAASSHFCGAEKTFRFPLELGSQRAPTASWTVTGDGAVVLAKAGDGPRITAATTGKIVDMGIKDVNNMGAAMAPAAADVMMAHFKDFGIQPDYYDQIVTGDLGHVGSALLVQLMQKESYDISQRHTDCGIEIYDAEKQNTLAGGSGCGCSAVTLAGYLLHRLRKKEINKLLFIPTGALHSVVTAQQGETIPGMAHAVAIENL